MSHVMVWSRMEDEDMDVVMVMVEEDSCKGMSIITTDLQTSPASS